MITPFASDLAETQRLLAVARGDALADLVLRNGQVVNVLTGEIYPADIAIAGKRIAAVSPILGLYQGHADLDLAGQYVAPGFIDAHVHIESSLLPPHAFASLVVPHGTTAVVSDPHEIANVHGLDGIRYMLADSADLDLRVYVMLSSCVPATTLETAGATLTAADLATLIDAPRVLGIAEVMNYPGVSGGDEDLLAKVRLGHQARLRIDGHAPRVTGNSLQAYIAAGTSSDHECTSAEEAREKLRLGMQILIREGSTAKNLAALLPIVTPQTARWCSFATDDKQPEDIATEGHLDHILRQAIAQGLDPVIAIQMATINTARHYGLRDQGAIAPGYLADLVTFSDLRTVRIDHTFIGGRHVAAHGTLITPQRSTVQPPINRTQALPLGDDAFVIPATGTQARIIALVPDQIITQEIIAEVAVQAGIVAPMANLDILKIAVVERHRGTGHVGLGLVQGFGVRRGALGSSIAHDSHNIIVVGATDAEMLLCARTLLAAGGGICVVEGTDVRGLLPLPIAGLMSDQPPAQVQAAMQHLLVVARGLGCVLANPFMALAFVALPVIPALKITDLGLVDVVAFHHVPLFVS